MPQIYVPQVRFTAMDLEILFNSDIATEFVKKLKIEIIGETKQFFQEVPIDKLNNTITINNLNTNESYELKLNFLDENGLNLTEIASIKRSTRLPEWKIEAPVISDRQVEINWTSNHDDIKAGI